MKTFSLTMLKELVSQMYEKFPQGISWKHTSSKNTAYLQEYKESTERLLKSIDGDERQKFVQYLELKASFLMRKVQEAQTDDETKMWRHRLFEVLIERNHLLLLSQNKNAEESYENKV